MARPGKTRSRAAKGTSARKSGAKKRAAKSAKKVAASKPAAKKATRPTEASPRTPASERFVRDLQVRGEAAKLSRKGKLPLAATHVITKTNPDGTIEVRRARLKAF